MKDRKKAAAPAASKATANAASGQAASKAAANRGRGGSPRVPAAATAAGLLLVAAGAAWFALRNRGEPAGAAFAELVKPGDAAGYNVVLVTLDTVRGDRLGTYGHALAETPHFDSLVERGVRFDVAVTTSPTTLPAHSSLMTGLYPPRHGVRDNGIFRLGAEQVTLAERLHQAGYETAAFVGCFVLDARYGLSQGFDTYDFQVDEKGVQPSNFDFNQRSADAVTDEAARWLRIRASEKRTAPFFLWVHYFDAHVPYQSPLGSEARFADRPYDAEIAFIDREFGRLLDELGRTGVRARTLIVVVADHGEGLREHDESTHGLFLYDSTLRIPFLISGDGLFDGAHRVSDLPVSLVDVRPTIEDLLGLPADSGMDGVSLARDAARDRALYVETKMPFHSARCSPLYGMRRLHDKYVEGPEPEYYDLRSDPAEARNLIRERPAEVGALAAALAELRAKWPDEGGADTPREMSAEEGERLRSLGYVHSEGEAPAGALPDPKAMMRASRGLTSALRLQKEHRLEEALREARAADAECPGYPDAAALIAQLCMELKRPDEAVAALEKCFTIHPIAGIALQLARTHLELKRFDAMDRALAEAQRLEPDNGFVYVLRGDRASLEGRNSAAIAAYEEALRVDEHRVGTLVRPVLARLKSTAGGR